MILEVIEQGKYERLNIRGLPNKELEGREFIGGYHLDGSFDEVWFDKEYWDVTLVSSANGTDTYRLVRKTS